MKVKVLVIIVLLALAAVVGFGIYKNQPQNVAIDALVGVSDEFLARDEITPIVKMFKSGSLYFGFGKTEDDNGESVTENFGAYGKIYFSEDAVALENIDILYDDFWVYGDAYISKDLLFVQEEKILNNAAIIALTKEKSNNEANFQKKCLVKYILYFLVRECVEYARN